MPLFLRISLTALVLLLGTSIGYAVVKNAQSSTQKQQTAPPKITVSTDKPLFTEKNWNKNSYVVKCIKLETDKENKFSSVKLFGTIDGALAPYINVTVQSGSGNVKDQDCQTFNYVQTLYQGPLAYYPNEGGKVIDSQIKNKKERVYRFIASSITDNYAVNEQIKAQAVFSFESNVDAPPSCDTFSFMPNSSNSAKRIALPSGILTQGFINGVLLKKASKAAVIVKDKEKITKRVKVTKKVNGKIKTTYKKVTAYKSMNVKRVKFYLNGNLVYTDIKAPYQYNFNKELIENLPLGLNTLTMKVTYKNNKTYTKRMRFWVANCSPASFDLKSNIDRKGLSILLSSGDTPLKQVKFQLNKNINTKKYKSKKKIGSITIRGTNLKKKVYPLVYNPKSSILYNKKFRVSYNKKQFNISKLDKLGKPTNVEIRLIKDVSSIKSKKCSLASSKISLTSQTNNKKSINIKARCVRK